MKIKKGYMLRQVAGNNIVVPVGEAALDFNGMITLNGTGVFLWNLLEKEINEDELASKLACEYNVDGDTALADVHEFVQKLLGASIVE